MTRGGSEWHRLLATHRGDMKAASRAYRIGRRGVPSAAYRSQRETRNKRPILQLPIAATGEKTGNCFVAAMLAHLHALDLETRKVAADEI